MIFYLDQFDCWGFWNETQSDPHGPFRTENGAKTCLAIYLNWLNGNGTEDDVFAWSPCVSDRAKELAYDLSRQADALGMESLTEDEQVLLSMVK